MSFYSDAQSQHSSVPPSAQPYQSLFGGSSQGTIDQVRYPHSQEDETLNQLDGHATAAGGPSVEYDASDDDLDYIQTSERETSNSPRGHYSVTQTLPDPHGKSTSRTRESEISKSPPAYRPNRFHGPAHLWLSLTRDDREIVESLDEIRARDLAAHLYNAHILQSQGVANLGSENVDQMDESESNDNELDNTNIPNMLEEWSAWPMSSDEVPRAGERLRRLEDDRWTFRMKSDLRPSAELEECITALLLKTSKERFNSREWASPAAPDRKGGAQSDTDGGVFGTEGDLKASQRSEGDGFSTTEWESEQETARSHLRPVVQLDDDESRRKLRPLARNVITQFEDLLMGLHRFHGAPYSDDGRSNRSRSRGRKRARSSSLASDMSSVYSRNTPTEASHTDTDGIRRRASSSRKRSVRAPERGYSRGRKRILRASQSSQQSNAHTESNSRPISRSNSRISNGRSGLTDWKDVAGIASMIGLPPAVLRRAARRFSALVGEDMEFPFPVIPDDPGPQFMESVLEWTYTQGGLVALGQDEPLAYPAPTSHLPPHRETSTRKRSTSPAGKTALKSADKASFSRDNGAKREQDLVCPFKKCNRHTKGFSRRWNLNQHLKTMHPSYQPKDNKSQTRSGVQSGYDSDMSE
ncbi:uncharacterized protein APUU_40564A [Aspergillus puulaauensis]|uniref:C2H2-type domain-containing protein n=1 Tax=Aspergillus puulaauensis TaxID=1220207 RepID=A0A7R7XMF4_9EURO|nr:uncharacterized protein APUU_40564A [Aspergillus puulaauensis]BCS24120.1 hypothetical protein APUU_40564A [Aspergillus puulaauensis]